MGDYLIRLSPFLYILQIFRHISDDIPFKDYVILHNQEIVFCFFGIMRAMKTNSPSKKFIVVSLFSGCGGLDLGFKGGFKVLGRTYRPKDFEIVWANDFDENACLTY